MGYTIGKEYISKSHGLVIYKGRTGYFDQVLLKFYSPQYGMQHWSINALDCHFGEQTND